MRNRVGKATLSPGGKRISFHSRISDLPLLSSMGVKEKVTGVMSSNIILYRHSVLVQNRTRLSRGTEAEKTIIRIRDLSACIRSAAAGGDRNRQKSCTFK